MVEVIGIRSRGIVNENEADIIFVFQFFIMGAPIEASRDSFHGGLFALVMQKVWVSFIIAICRDCFQYFVIPIDGIDIKARTKCPDHFYLSHVFKSVLL